MTVDGERYWDRIALAWQRAGPPRLWRRHCDAVNCRLLDRWLPPGPLGEVLKTDLFDEAFGRGVYALLAARAGQVTGIDISPTVAQAAAQKHPGLRAVVADVRSLPFPDAAFDAIASISTLDHFESRREILVSLRELARVLRPGGRLLLTLDNLANPSVWLRSALPMGWLNRAGIVPYHVGATLTPGGLRRHLRLAGLKTLQTTAILHCPRAAAVALANRLDRRPPPQGKRLLRLLMAMEEMETWPTRFQTGYYVAVLAVRPACPGRQEERKPE